MLDAGASVLAEEPITIRPAAEYLDLGSYAGGPHGHTAPMRAERRWSSVKGYVWAAYV